MTQIVYSVGFLLLEHLIIITVRLAKLERFAETVIGPERDRHGRINLARGK
jgi:hypothetical protein